jgi:hypothetical protein
MFLKVFHEFRAIGVETPSIFLGEVLNFIPSVGHVTYLIGSIGI